MTKRQENCYGNPFEVGRGVTQGDIVSTTIFNIIVDAMVHVVQQEIGEVYCLYYDDDGLISRTNRYKVQNAIDLTSTLFQSFGLQMNVEKMKAMVSGIIYIHVWVDPFYFFIWVWSNVSSG